MTPSQMVTPRFAQATTRRAYAVRDEFALMRKIMLDPELTRSAVAVAGAILEHINRVSGLTYLSQETIALKARISVSAVKRAVSSLHRYIAVEAGGGRGRANIYRLRIEPAASCGMEIQSDENWPKPIIETGPNQVEKAHQTRPGMTSLPGSFIKPTPTATTAAQRTAIQPETKSPATSMGEGESSQEIGKKKETHDLVKLITRGFYMSSDRATLLIEQLLPHVPIETVRSSIGTAMLDGVNRDQLPGRLRLLLPKRQTVLISKKTPTAPVTTADDLHLRATADRYESLPRKAKEELLGKLKAALVDQPGYFETIYRYPVMISKKLIEYGLM